MCSTPAYMSYSRSIRRYFVGSNRRWDRYNRSLVDRVHDLLNPGFLQHWRILLEEINRGKRGRPFKTPNAFILFLAKIRAMFGVPFRTLQALARIISSATGIPCLSYSRIFKRIRSIRPALDPVTGKMDGAIDSSGFKITMRGDYLGSKWKKKRKGWNKLHVVVSIHDVSVLSFSITDEHGNDSRNGRKLLEKVARSLKSLLGDKAYDSRGIHNLLSDAGVKAIIPPRKNASTQAKGSPARARVVRRVRKIGEDQWKKENEYGRRWLVEIYFSGLKRTMGEVIKATRPDNIAQEIAMKVVWYNEMRHMTEAY